MKNWMKMIVAIMCVAVLACGCNKKGNTENATDEPVAQKSEVVCNEPAIEVAFGDYDGMFALSKKAQNFELQEGQVVIIDGELTFFMSEASIGERNADGEFIGTTLKINGFEKGDLPDDGTRAKVTAKVAKNADYFFEYLAAEAADVEITPAE